MTNTTSNGIKIFAIVILVLIVMTVPIQSPYVFAMPSMPENIERQLYDLGVIDKNKAPGELSMLNMFWALGLANKNDILEHGPMIDPQYGGAGGFASTGGWTLAQGNAMDHYSMNQLITLTPEQQKMA